VKPFAVRVHIFSRTDIDRSADKKYDYGEK
jgi:hypothetical protein